MMVNYIVKEKVIFIIYYFTTFLNFYSLGAKKLEILTLHFYRSICVTLNSLIRCIVLHPGPAFRGAGPQLFSVKPAVCCVYLNSRQQMTPARCPVGSNWYYWLNVGPICIGKHAMVVAILQLCTCSLKCKSHIRIYEIFNFNCVTFILNCLID